MLKITWKDCEPCLKNWWKNIAKCDEVNNLTWSCKFLQSWYNFPQNRGKTPKDLELALREHRSMFCPDGLKMGLIAVDYKSDPKISDAIDKNKNMVIAKLYSSDQEHSCKHYVKVSCRKREDVIKETLQSSKDMEENLGKLDESGYLTFIQSSDTKEANDDKKKDEAQLISECRKLIEFTRVEFSTVFNNCTEKYPDSKLNLYGLSQNGGSIFALVYKEKIVCPIGILIYINSNGKKIQQYTLLE